MHMVCARSPFQENQSSELVEQTHVNAEAQALDQRRRGRKRETCNIFIRST